MEDLEKCIPFALGGTLLGLGVGLAKLKLRPQKEVDYHKLLTFEPEYFFVDPICAQFFQKLQYYCVPEINSADFELAGSAADAILCLVYELSKGDLEWKSKYGLESSDHFRNVDKHLFGFFGKTKYWLWDAPLNRLTELQTQGEKEAEKIQFFQERVSSGETSAREVLKLVKLISDRLKIHVLKMTLHKLIKSLITSEKKKEKILLKSKKAMPKQKSQKKKECESSSSSSSSFCAEKQNKVESENKVGNQSAAGVECIELIIKLIDEKYKPRQKAEEKKEEKVAEKKQKKKRSCSSSSSSSSSTCSCSCSSSSSSSSTCSCSSSSSSSSSCSFFVEQ